MRIVTFSLDGTGWQQAPHRPWDRITAAVGELNKYHRNDRPLATDEAAGFLNQRIPGDLYAEDCGDSILIRERWGTRASIAYVDALRA